MPPLRGAFRLQLQLIRRNPDYFMDLVRVAIFTVIFLSVVRHAGRDDLVPYAVMGPVLIGLWSNSLFIAGEIIQNDRWAGILEALVATPAPLSLTIVSRVFAVTAFGLFGFAEAWIVSRFGFGVTIAFHHPALFLLAVTATALAMSGTALVMSAAFAFGRRSRPFQRALSYPFYVLGGVLVPISYLPDAVQPLAKGVFLSWSGDLLRATLQPGAITDPFARVLVIVALGAVGFLVGWQLTEAVIKRVRRLGTLTHA